MAGWVAGKAENIDQLSPAKLEFGLGLSLAIRVEKQNLEKNYFDFLCNLKTFSANF